jgi:hypothetical protein
MDEVHSLCYYGNGGFTHNDVYEMPIRYRHYHLKKMLEFLEKQNKNISSDDSSQIPLTPDKIQVPDFITNIKAPKK